MEFIVIAAVLALAVFAVALFWYLQRQLSGVCSEDNWCWQNPLPWGNRFRCVQFVDGEIGYVVGFKWHVWRTDNGGRSWQLTPAEVSGIVHHPCVGNWYYDAWDLHDICFVSATRGWGVGDSGVIVTTSDGGRHWTLQDGLEGGPHRPREPTLYSVHFVNDEIGCAVGEIATGCISPTGTRAVILQTEDGGVTWEEREVEESIEHLRAVAFVANVGWAVGSRGTILHSVDQGRTWIRQQSGTAADLTGVTFVDASRGWAVGSRVIVHTADGGETWELEAEGDWWINDVTFNAQGVGIACGARGVILRYAEGEWHQVLAEIFTGRNHAPDLTHVTTGAGHFWIVGAGGCILQSTGNESIWIERGATGSLDQYMAVAAPAERHVWVRSCWCIRKTTDGGATWETHTPLSDSYESVYYDSMCVRGAVCWVLCTVATPEGFLQCKLLRTTDGGVSWMEKFSSSEHPTAWVQFSADGTAGLFVARFPDGKPIIYRTLDVGDTWEEAYRGDTPTTVRAILFSGYLRAWVWLGNGNHLLRSVDRGSTWQEVSLAPLERISAICFLDDQLGWAFGTDLATGYGGKLCRTQNGGDTWQPVEYDFVYQGSRECFPLSVTCMQFADSQRGWLCGLAGEVLRTEDGGRTWIHLETGTHNGLQAIAGHGSSGIPAWVVGNDGTILRCGEPLSKGMLRRVDLTSPVLLPPEPMYPSSRAEQEIATGHRS